MTDTQPKKKMSTGTKVLIGCLGCGVLVIGAIVLIFVLGIAAAGSALKDSRPSVQTSGSQDNGRSANNLNSTSQVPVEIPAIGAAKLNAQYKANEVAADEVFKGKTYIVLGRVSQISKDGFGNIWIGLDTGEMLADVHCSIPESLKPIAIGLSKGQPIAVRGTVQGMVLMSVMMDVDAIKEVKSDTNLKQLQTEPW